jgi:rhamnogalacturonyl hydrolase YesR
MTSLLNSKTERKFDPAELTGTAQLVYQSLKKVEKWVEDHDYKGYEPFDGLSSWFRPLTFGNLFLDRLLLQLIRQSPINLRSIFGIKPLDSTIGRGYMAWGYCQMLKLTGDSGYKTKAVSCLEWLIENKSPGYEEYSWGKHFDFASRGGLYKAFEPILIWTALIGHAFLEAYEVFGEKKFLEVADSICRWIVKLPRNQTDSGFCMGYHNFDRNSTIHNSNMVGAAVLARTAKHTGNQEYLEVAKGAMIYSCTRQLPNGAWLYGEDPMNHWIDNFHTGYNLDALKCYIEYSSDKEYESILKKGLDFYKKHFFEESGRPRYYHDRTYPVDSQCASQAIDTLANFADFNEESLELAEKVANWTIKNMQNGDGFFCYRQYPLGIKVKATMLHWSQATSYKALALLFSKIKIIFH